MPIFSYRCKNCSHVEEDVLVKNSNVEYNCPKCGAVMERLFPTGTTFYLKGKGWYKDGYNKNTKKESTNKSIE